jgi:branched-chain amino acid aminotransferase
MRAPDQVWFNGRIVPIDSAAPSVASNTLHLGTAVFDGMMAYWNEDRWNLHLLDGHVARFTRGSANMDLAHGYDADAITTAIRELVATLPPKTHYIRPLAYRTGPEVFFTVEHDTSSVCIFATPVERDIDTPYRCQLSPVVRVAGRAIPVEWKVSGAYANSYRCEQEARRAGFDTGVMLDVDGNVCEASSSNLFFVRDTTLVTPAAKGDLFPGLTRRLVIDRAEALGLKVDVREVSVDELADIDAAFLCGTLSEIRPISCVGDVTWPSADNETYRAVLHDFRSITHQ